MPFSKQQIRDRILDELRATLALQTGAAQLARDEAISDESRAENQYDTHSLEAGYLAEGQARQAKEIEESIGIVSALPLPEFPSGSPIALGAWCDVAESATKTTSYFLCPRAGGLEIAMAGKTVMVVTPSSPLGRALLGKREGDVVQLPGRRPPAMATIAAVR